jgi:two-component system response regulator FixJ
LKIFLIEDDSDVAAMVSGMLAESGFQVEKFCSGDGFIDNWDRSLAGCVLLDERMPGKSGLEVLSKLPETFKILPVILFTSVVDMQVAIQAGKLGAFDLCPKPFAPEVLLSKIKRALEENKERLNSDLERVRAIEGIGHLSNREREVLDLLCEGKTSKQIATELKISHLTVDNHRARIFAKMKVKTVAQLVRLSMKARQ